MELIDKEAKVKLAAYSGKKQRVTVQFNSGTVRAPSHVPIHIAVKYTLTNKHKQRFEFLLIHHAAKRQKTQVSFEGVCVFIDRLIQKIKINLIMLLMLFSVAVFVVLWHQYIVESIF